MGNLDRGLGELGTRRAKAYGGKRAGVGAAGAGDSFRRKAGLTDGRYVRPRGGAWIGPRQCARAAHLHAFPAESAFSLVEIGLRIPPAAIDQHARGAGVDAGVATRAAAFERGLSQRPGRAKRDAAPRPITAKKESPGEQHDPTFKSLGSSMGIRRPKPNGPFDVGQKPAPSGRRGARSIRTGTPSIRPNLDGRGGWLAYAWRSFHWGASDARSEWIAEVLRRPQGRGRR